MPHAQGTFEVQLVPQVGDNGEVTGATSTTGAAGAAGAAETAPIGRLAIAKQFRGDLEATSRGQMLSAAGSMQGSAGYVAMERVEGSLHGRKGSFVLQHSGTMARGAPELTISVVPDSGSGELVGLAGTMQIGIEGDSHSYSFTYTLDNIDDLDDA
jgi:hypothetical protein